MVPDNQVLVRAAGIWAVAAFFKKRDEPYSRPGKTSTLP
jgi:hypothetical protein